VFECQPNIKVTDELSTSEFTSSQSGKWRKEQPFILNHKSCLNVNRIIMKVTYRLRTSEYPDHASCMPNTYEAVKYNLPAEPK